MLVYDLERIYPFLKERIPGLMAKEGSVGIGWVSDGSMTAGAVFEDFNGVTVWAHVALDHLPRTYLRAFLAYPFEVCKVRSLRGYVLASNTKLRNLARRLGAAEEAVLKDAAPDGDVVICTLWRERHEPLA